MDLGKYNISASRGFLPLTDPIVSLPSSFQAWEVVAAHLPDLIRGKTVREEVDRLPPFPTDDLCSEAEWWRAFCLLTFVSHSYVWCEGDRGVARSLPEVLAVPWCKVARHLDMPPVVTHSTAVLHNWRRIDENGEMNRDNLKSLFSFTGTVDEEWFYLDTVLVEITAIRFIKQIPAILKNCVEQRNNSGLVENLHEVEQAIKAVQDAIYHMRDKCKPAVFYTQIRTFHAGWFNSDVLPEGLSYKGVSDTPLQYCGGNAGQSSILATLDTLLGVEHGGSVLEFNMTQREHMVREHRHFLKDLKATVTLKDYVRSSNDDQLLTAYNKCVQALVELRCEHIKLVSLYIVIQKSKEGGQVSLQTKGTGGTGFMQYLKTSRDDTIKTKL
ncbi:indoleamine 2,3-dioxygenase 2-like [Dysidea avara]|uniref:indoleamine 2,3-dioxygenase 2-like n=1 Tax=Dysidea avara TaxID=196820 RepID=UPI00332F1355